MLTSIRRVLNELPAAYRRTLQEGAPSPALQAALVAAGGDAFAVPA
jgi:hypothetical protein